MKNTTDTPQKPPAQPENSARLKAALLDLGKADYERVRAELIERLGYDAFRDMQNAIFKEIGTIAAETSSASTLSDWQKARILGKRAFYERSTQTIRACPENYCLAHRDPDSPAKQPAWKRYGNDNATRNWWSEIDKVLDTYGRWSTGDALATAIGKAIKTAGAAIKHTEEQP